MLCVVSVYAADGRSVCKLSSYWVMLRSPDISVKKTHLLTLWSLTFEFDLWTPKQSWVFQGHSYTKFEHFRIIRWYVWLYGLANPSVCLLSVVCECTLLRVLTFWGYFLHHCTPGHQATPPKITKIVQSSRRLNRNHPVGGIRRTVGYLQVQSNCSILTSQKNK